MAKKQTKEEKKAALYKLRAARCELEAVGWRDRSKGIYDETDDYHVANSRVIEAEKHVSKWRR